MQKQTQVSGGKCENLEAHLKALTIKIPTSAGRNGSCL